MKRILIIEDNPVHSRLMGHELRSGYDLVFAADSGTALAYLSGDRASHFDLVILDSLIPKRAGELPSVDEAIRIMRDFGGGLSVVLVSGNPTEHLRREFERRGVKRVFGKPFSLTEFRAFVDRILGEDVDEQDSC